MSIHSNSDIAGVMTADTKTGHTFAISAADVVTETPTVGPAVVHSGIAAAQNDAARADAVFQLHHDINFRVHGK